MEIKTSLRNGKPYFTIKTRSCTHGFYDKARAKAFLARLSATSNAKGKDAPLVKPKTQDVYEREGWQL